MQPQQVNHNLLVLKIREQQELGLLDNFYPAF